MDFGSLSLYKSIIKKLFQKMKTETVKWSMLLSAILFLSVWLLLLKNQIFPSFISTFFLVFSIALFIVLLLNLITDFLKKLRPVIENNIQKKRNRCIQAHAAKGSPIRVGFFCDSPAYWTSFQELYTLLKNDPRFQVVLIAVPELQNGKVVNYDIAGFFDNCGYSYEKIYQDGSYKKIKDLHLDYIFPSRPYDHLRPAHMSNTDLRKNSKLCHITYGTCIFNGKTLDIVCGFQHLRYYDFVFSETPDHTTIYTEKKRRYPSANTQIIQVGSPKFDYIHYRDFTPPHTTYDQVILYTPRWTTSENACSFLDIYQQLFELAEENRNIKYIFRPHPLMKKFFLEKIWKEEEWEDFVAKFDRLENAEIDFNPNYLPSFKEATVLISDLSSLLPEFLLTKKPIIYFHKKYQFNTFGKHIAEGYYWCHNWDEVNNVLNSLRNGNDPKAKIREDVMNQYFYFGSKTSPELIRDFLLEDYQGVNTLQE